MSNMIGMDVDLVENIGNQVIQQSEAVSHAMTAIDGLVNQAEAAWKGQDANQFRDQWQSSYRSSLTQLVQALHEFGNHAKQEAADQRGVSGS